MGHSDSHGLLVVLVSRFSSLNKPRRSPTHILLWGFENMEHFQGQTLPGGWNKKNLQNNYGVFYAVA